MMKKKMIINGIKRRFDYYLSLSYMRMLGYLCLIFVVLLVSVMLFLWGVSLIYEKLNLGEVNVPGTAFMLLTDPGNISDVLPNNHSWVLGIVYALISIVGAVLFGGVLISLMSNSLQLRVEDFKNGNVQYLHNDHIIVIGYDNVLPALVKQLNAHERFAGKDILIFTKKNSQEVREALSTVIDVKNKHIILYSGRRNSMVDLSKVQVEKAKEIFIIGDRDSDDHDARNFACLSNIVEIVKKSGTANKPIVNILLEDLSTQVMLQSTNLAQEWREHIRMIPFNFYESWARQVLSGGQVLVETNNSATYNYPYIQVDKDSEEHVNIVIFGMSDLGITVGVEAAHALHYPHLPNGKVRKTRITFVSKLAYDEMLLFKTRYRQIFEIQSSTYMDFMGDADDVPESLPRITKFAPTYFTGKDADFLDIDFEFVRGDAFSEKIHGFLKDRVSDGNCKMNIFTCTGNDSIDMNIGLMLPEEVLRKSNVFIRQHHTGQLITWLHQINRQSDGKYSNVYPFGMVNSKFDLTHKSLEMGILLNYFYLHTGTEETYQSDHLMTSEECKEALDKWNKETSIADQWSSSYCCYSFALKMAQYGITSIDEHNIGQIQTIINEHIDTLAYIEHNRWNMEKLLLGFRKPHQEEAHQINECRKNIADTVKDKELKAKCMFRIFKSQYQVHDYIRSFEDLKTIQWIGKEEKDDICKIDNNMLSQIPWIINNRKQLQQYL